MIFLFIPNLRSISSSEVHPQGSWGSLSRTRNGSTAQHPTRQIGRVQQRNWERKTASCVGNRVVGKAKVRAQPQSGRQVLDLAAEGRELENKRIPQGKLRC